MRTPLLVLTITALVSFSFVAACLSSSECSADADCLGDDVCSAGVCVQCQSDNDCDDGEVCSNNECEPFEVVPPAGEPDGGSSNNPGSCGGDADCGEGEICSAGQCIVGERCCVDSVGLVCATGLDCAALSEECNSQCAGSTNPGCLEECARNDAERFVCVEDANTSCPGS